MAMATSCFFQLLLVLVACTAAVATNESPMAPAPGPSSSSPAASFLHASCAAVDHADACYNLLLPYVDSFHGSLARVARTSAGLAITRQQGLTDEIGHLNQSGTGAGRMADMVLADCFKTVSTEAQGANKTLAHLDHLVAGVKGQKDFASEKLFAQDWLYSSASSMSECIDWIHDDPARSSPVLKEVATMCASVAPYMLIAMDLTDSIKFESVITVNV